MSSATTIETNSKSKQVAAKVLYEAFTILKKAGGQLPGREVVNQIEQNLTFTPWETSRYEKSGYIRWQSILHFYTIDAIKAGFLRKQKGIWILTSEGEEAMKLGQMGLLEKANEAYKVWKGKNKETEIEVEPKDTPVSVQSQKANLDLIQEQALSGLREYMKKLNPYEFQDLVAALLHGMGYFISFVSPRGKDNGLDIIAYQDPLGTKPPRIKVQVKHRPDFSIPVGEIKSLIGSLGKDGDVGLFVTSGRFTSDAESFARSSISTMSN